MSSSDDLVTAEELALYAERQRVLEEEKPRKRKNVKRVGTRVERIVARALDAIPRVRARRIPGSGAFESLPHDVVATWGDRDTAFEVKARKTSGWKTLEKWRGGADVLVLWELHHPDRARVYMDWESYLALVASQAQEDV